jgi:nitroreductase
VEVFEAVRTVLAVREFRDQKVPAEIVRRIVEAGRLSASGSNRQPWHFIVVEQRATLEALGRSMRTGPYIADAAFAVAVMVETDSKLGASDGSRAIQDMILTAWADGIGSNWVGFGPMPAAEKLLEVPAAYHGLGIVAFGFPAAKLGRGKKKRKPVGEVASREKFGTPFA